MTQEKFYVTKDGRRITRRILKSPRQFLRGSSHSSETIAMTKTIAIAKKSKAKGKDGVRVQHDKVPLKPLKNASPHSKSTKLFAQAREALRQENQLLAEQRQLDKLFAQARQAATEKSNGKRNKKDKAHFNAPQDFEDKTDERKERDWNQLWQLFVQEKSKQGVSAGPDFQPHWTGKMLLPKNPNNLRKIFFAKCWDTRYEMNCQRGLKDYKNLFHFNKVVNLDTYLRHLFYGHQTWNEPLFHTVTTTSANGELVEQKVEIPRLKVKEQHRISVLDCGGGQGRALAQILKQLKRANSEYVQAKIGKFVGIGLHVWTKLGSRLKRHHKQMEWYVTDALKAASYLKANSFDAIIDSFGAYYYSANKAEILSAYLRLLRPGSAGFVVVGGKLETLIEPMSPNDPSIAPDGKPPIVNADEERKVAKIKPQYFEEYLEKMWPKIFTMGESKNGGARWLLIRKPKSYTNCIPNLSFPVKSFVWESIISVGNDGKSNSQVVKPTKTILQGQVGLGYCNPTLLGINMSVAVPWSWSRQQLLQKL